MCSFWSLFDFFLFFQIKSKFVPLSSKRFYNTLTPASFPMACPARVSLEHAVPSLASALAQVCCWCVSPHSSFSPLSFCDRGTFTQILQWCAFFRLLPAEHLLCEDTGQAMFKHRLVLGSVCVNSASERGPQGAGCGFCSHTAKSKSSNPGS